MKNAQKLAEQWRLKNPEYQSSGVVLIWEGKVYGWKDKLRNPEHERPKAIAVDVDDNVFIAEGGDDDNGAKRWVVFNSEHSETDCYPVSELYVCNDCASHDVGFNDDQEAFCHDCGSLKIIVE